MLSPVAVVMEHTVRNKEPFCQIAPSQYTGMSKTKKKEFLDQNLVVIHYGLNNVIMHFVFL